MTDHRHLTTKIQVKPIPPLYSYINNINLITYIHMFGDPSPEVIEAIAAARRGDALKSREQLEREKKEREKKGK